MVDKQRILALYRMKWWDAHMEALEAGKKKILAQDPTLEWVMKEIVKLNDELDMNELPKLTYEPMDYVTENTKSKLKELSYKFNEVYVEHRKYMEMAEAKLELTTSDINAVAMCNHLGISEGLYIARWYPINRKSDPYMPEGSKK